MKRNILIALSVLVSIGFCALWYSTNNSLQGANLVIQQQSVKLQENDVAIETINTELAKVKSDLSDVQTKLTDTTNTLEATKTGLEVVSEQLATARKDLSTVQEELSVAESELFLYKDTYGTVVASGVQPPYHLNADIINNSNSANPTFAQVVEFIVKGDRTDEKPYVDNFYMCGDYATEVHNNAEKFGIRTAFVAIKFSDVSHACNAFKTVDKGLIFVDCTGMPANMERPLHFDKTVDVALESHYQAKSIIPEYGWNTYWVDMGEILDVQIYW